MQDASPSPSPSPSPSRLRLWLDWVESGGDKEELELFTKRLREEERLRVERLGKKRLGGDPELEEFLGE